MKHAWLKSEISNSSLFIPNLYRIFRLDRQTHGGGIALLIRNNINALTESTILFPCLELLHVTLSFPSSMPINVITTPSCNFISFLNCFTNFLNNIDYSNIPLLILGDFNINLLNNKCHLVKKFKSSMADYGLHILNKLPTRNTYFSHTQIDLLLVNNLAKSFVNTIITSPCAFSDHELLTFGYKKLKITATSKEITTKILSNTNLKLFNDNIVNIDLSFPLNAPNNVNALLENYMASINTAIY